MLYLLHQLFFEDLKILRIFKSITIRASISFFLALLFVLILGKPFIAWLKKKKYGDTVREEGPQSHFSKSGTPTMGGLLIIGAILFATAICGNFSNKFIVFLFFITILFSTIGFYDDYLKLTKHKKGLSSKKKILGQLIITILTFIFIYKYGLISPRVDFSIVNPIIKNSYFYITPALFFVFMAVVIIGSSNAVNLTDGLDGLAIGPAIVACIVFSIFIYITGNARFASYLLVPYMPGVGEVTVFCAALVGSGLGFLWFNAYPAQVFMGDVGSLSIGGVLGYLALLCKQELVLAVVGGLFVAETLSVIVQVGYFRWTGGKRFFRMAPLHHHFELKGVPESKIIIRFWITSILLGLMALSVLKLR